MQIQNLNKKKSCQYSDIPNKIIEEFSNTYADILCKSIINLIKTSLGTIDTIIKKLSKGKSKIVESSPGLIPWDKTQQEGIWR